MIKLLRSPFASRSRFSTPLKSYTVHVRKNDPRAYETPEFVEEGFSWLAFFFAPFWALYHRLWVVACVLISFNILLTSAIRDGDLAYLPSLMLQFGVFAIFAFMADELRRKSLARRGYVMADIVVGESLAQAHLRFFEKALGARGAVPAP